MITGRVHLNLATGQDSRRALGVLDTTPTGASVTLHVGERRPSMGDVWLIIEHATRLNFEIEAATPLVVKDWLDQLRAPDVTRPTG